MLFLESLKVMGLGMLGIFTVTVALVLITNENIQKIFGIFPIKVDMVFSGRYSEHRSTKSVDGKE